jgi:hypothetical protein
MEDSEHGPAVRVVAAAQGSLRMRHSPRALATLVGAAWILAGCGGTTKTVIVQGPPAPATSGGAGGQTSTPTSSTATTAKTPSEAPTSIVHREAFLSPTGNIGCMIVAGTSARCDIAKRNWSPPPRPSSCPNVVDFGQGLEVGNGAARFVCAGDTARDPSSGKLRYGTASQVGAFTCVSRVTGMTCTDSSTGHGFTISVQGYRLF